MAPFSIFGRLCAGLLVCRWVVLLSLRVLGLSAALALGACLTCHKKAASESQVLNFVLRQNFL